MIHFIICSRGLFIYLYCCEEGQLPDTFLKMPIGTNMAFQAMGLDQGYAQTQLLSSFQFLKVINATLAMISSSPAIPCPAPSPCHLCSDMGLTRILH